MNGSRTTRRGTARLLVALATAVLLAVLSTATAQAAFSGQGTATSTVSTATLAAPTNVTLTGQACYFTVLCTVTVNWSAVPKATGYQVVPYSNGAAQTAVSVTAGNSYTYWAVVQTNTTWQFAVTATLQLWTSPAAKSAAVKVA